MIHTLRERHLLPMSTPATILTRVRRVDLDELTPSFFRFGTQLGEKGRPCRVTNRLGKAMGMHHPVHMQILNTDETKAVNNLSGLLMRDAETALRIGETVIPSVAFEAWIPWFLTSLRIPNTNATFVASSAQVFGAEGFDTSVKRFHGKVYSYRHVLKHLRVNTLERGALFFQHRIAGLLPITTQTLALVLIRCFAVLKQVVIKPSAFFKRSVKRFELGPGWVHPILKVFKHMCITGLKVKDVKRVVPFIPMTRSQGPSDNFW